MIWIKIRRTVLYYGKGAAPERRWKRISGGMSCSLRFAEMDGGAGHVFDDGYRFGGGNKHRCGHCVGYDRSGECSLTPTISTIRWGRSGR